MRAVGQCTEFVFGADRTYPAGHYGPITYSANRCFCFHVGLLTGTVRDRSVPALFPFREGSRMQVVTRTADWLQLHARAPDSGSAGDELLGAIALLSSELEWLPTFEAPRAELFAALEGELAGVPPQSAHVDPSGAFARWMAVAALAEHHGEPRLAQLIVDRVADLVQSSADVGQDAPDDWRAEALGLCWCRRGRLSRVAGDHDDAVECYRQAARLASALPWRDARPQAQLGLAAVAAVRGNWPEVGRRMRAMLNTPSLADVYRIPAHQMLALAERKKGDLIDALLHSWAAFDILAHDDFRRQELMLTMGEIAADLGNVEAAVHAFDEVATVSAHLRLRSSAMVGGLRASLRRSSGPAAQLRERIAALRALVQEPLAPRDEVMVLIAMAEGALQLGETSDVEGWLASAGPLAHHHGFNEQQFRIEALLEQLQEVNRGRSHAASRKVQQLETAAVRPRSHVAGHAAVRRLVHTTLA
jgi:tetratricopeptide (TPR) repeat protein